MKTVNDLAKDLKLEIVSAGDGMERVPEKKLYCCDLLSIVMGRAPHDGVWVTVMANINTVAVAVLCDLACVVIAEGMAIDTATIAKARQQGVVLLKTAAPVYETAKAIERYLCDET